MKTRAFLLWIHLYGGLLFGCGLALMGVTGSALVFRQEIEARLVPQTMDLKPQAARVSLQSIVETVEKRHPNHEIQHIFMARNERAAHEIRLQKFEASIYVDPYDGRIIEERAPQDSAMGWLADLHTDLLSGERGHFVVGVNGVLMILLGLSGLWLWWPGVARWRRGFTIHRNAGWKGINYDLHRVGGALVSLGLIVVALCGVALVWSAPITDFLNRLARTPTPPKIALAPSRAPMRSLDELVKSANEAFPQGEVRRISFPAKSGAPLVIRKKTTQEIHPVGMNFISMDPFQGRVLRVESAAQASWATRLLNLRYPLHIGVWGGLASRVLHMALGLTPALLFVSGFLMWWNRLSARRRRARGRTQRAAASQ